MNIILQEQSYTSSVSCMFVTSLPTLLEHFLNNQLALHVSHYCYAIELVITFLTTSCIPHDKTIHGPFLGSYNHLRTGRATQSHDRGCLAEPEIERALHGGEYEPSEQRKLPRWG